MSLPTRLSLVLLTLPIACSSLDVPVPDACGPNGSCPTGYTCEPTSNRCILDVTIGPPDAREVSPAADAPLPPDAGGVDAPRPDAAPADAAPADARSIDARSIDAPSIDAMPGAPPTVQWLDGTTPEDGARTNLPAAHLAFGFTTPAEAVGAHLECSDGGAAFAPCVSPVDLAVPIVTGNDPHTFAVRGVRSDGVAGPPIMRSWLLDTVKPVVVITGTPADGSITSATSTSFTLAFVPPEPADSVIECSRTGLGGVFAADACTNLSGLPDGSHAFAARGRDVAGNIGDPAVVSWTVDSTLPAVVLGGTPTDGSVTRTTSTSFTFAFVGTVPGGVLECKRAGPGTAETFAAAGCRNRDGLADGTWTFSLRGRDAAGNLSGVESVTWTVDTVQPAVAFGPCTPDDGVITDSGAVNYTWDFVDPADRIGGQLELSLDGIVYTPSDGTFVTTVTTDGLFRFWARGVDAAGNVGPPIQRSFTLSTVGPAVTIGGTPVDGGFLRVPSPSFTFTSVAGATFECTIDGGASAACAADAVNAMAFADGAHTLSVRARLGGGAAGDPQTVNFVVDTIAPVSTLTSGNPADGALTRIATWTIQFAVDDSTATASCVWDGAPETCTSPASHTFASDGAHSVFVTAEDPAGNPGPPSSTFSYTLDRQQPQITFDAVPPNGSKLFTIRWHVDKVCTFSCGVDGGQGKTTCTTTDGISGSANVDVRNVGTTQHHFTVLVTDQAGNTNTATAAWTT